MSIQTINIGNIVNDGLGDDLRTAFQKVNANFAELNSTLTVTASNLLVNQSGNIFKQKVGNNLEFKSLVAGSKIQFTSSVDSIRIDSTAADSFVQITTNSGIVRASENQGITLQGGDDITVSANNGVITVNSNFGLSDIFTSLDFGYIRSTFDNTVQFNTSQANIDFGTFANPGLLYVDLGTFSGT
jgi:hypothetical protein